MKTSNNLIILFFLFTLTVFSACSKDEEKIEHDVTELSNDQVKNLLTNKVWMIETSDAFTYVKYYKVESYTKDYPYKATNTNNYYDIVEEAYIRYKSESYGTDSNEPTKWQYRIDKGMMYHSVGAYYIVSISDKELVLTNGYKDNPQKSTYKTVTSIPNVGAHYNSIGGGSTSGGGSSSKEELNYLYNDITEYTSSATVKFYFDSRISSAKISYGTTSSASTSVSTSVSGMCAYATISNLKNNTDYYIKCTAKTSSGATCTTDVVRYYHHNPW